MDAWVSFKGVEQRKCKKRTHYTTFQIFSKKSYIETLKRRKRPLTVGEAKFSKILPHESRVCSCNFSFMLKEALIHAVSVSLSTNSTDLLKRRLVDLNSKSFQKRNDFEYNATNLRSSKQVESVHRLVSVR